MAGRCGHDAARCRHARWSRDRRIALNAGGTLEDRPTWTNSTTFFPFPFPANDTGLSDALADRIRRLAEQLDAHRKTQQAAHADLTLTGMYNVLEKLRAGEPLTANERKVYDHGLVGVLRTLHDELDAAVLEAYGWSGALGQRNDAQVHLRARVERSNALDGKPESLLIAVIEISHDGA